MTAYINKIKDKAGNQQLPVTHERAVRDDNGTTLESKMQNLEGAMDKAYVASSDNGMGRITLKKNMVSGVNTLTQAMMQATNTIYVIQHDFTLASDVTIPANCILEFEGGSLNGVNNTYTLTGNNTIISYNSYNIFKGLQVAGTFTNDSVVIDIFDDEDWSIKMTKSNFISRNLRMIGGSTYNAYSTFTTGPGKDYGLIDGSDATINVHTNNTLIKLLRGTRCLDIRKIYATSVSETHGTFIDINGDDVPPDARGQVRMCNLYNLHCYNFEIGIEATSLRHSTIRDCMIDAAVGVLYNGKSAEIEISGCLFNNPDLTRTDTAAIRCYNEGQSNYPEGLTLTACTLNYHYNPLDIRDIFVLNVNNCYIESTNTSGRCILSPHNFVQSININNNVFHKCLFSIGNATSQAVFRCNINGCIFEENASAHIFILNRCYGVSITNIIQTSTIAKVDSSAILNVSNTSYNVYVDNVFVENITYSILTNQGGYNVELRNIRGTSKSYIGNSQGSDKFYNVDGVVNTPILNEVRRVDGVAKYWDGSAWQTM